MTRIGNIPRIILREDRLLLFRNIVGVHNLSLAHVTFDLTEASVDGSLEKEAARDPYASQERQTIETTVLGN